MKIVRKDGPLAFVHPPCQRLCQMDDFGKSKSILSHLTSGSLLSQG